VIPPERDAHFVARMEALLALYLAPPDPDVPLICLDEAGKELHAHTRAPQPLTFGQPAREDPEYDRHGSASLFMCCAPHLGWRHVTVTDQRRRVEWAHMMRELVDVHFPNAERLIVVLDNLNTHTYGALYHVFPAPEARRIARKLDLRFTPVHGSWLNIAEIELRVLSDQCLRRRVATREDLAREVTAWVTERNAAGIGVDWRFGPDDARRAMPTVYPEPVCAS